MLYFYWLLLAHLLADYPLQTDWIYAQKVRSLAGGGWHAGVLLACYALALAPFLTDWRVAAGIVAITFLHFLQDSYKASNYDHAHQNALPGYLLDQLLHVATYAALAFFCTQLGLLPPAWWAAAWQTAPYAGFFAAGLFLVTFAWDVTAHVAVRHTLTAKTYRRDWRGIGLRAAVWTAAWTVFLAIF